MMVPKVPQPGQVNKGPLRLFQSIKNNKNTYPAQTAACGWPYNGYWHICEMEGGMQRDNGGVRGAALIMLACVAWSFSGVLSKWTPWGPLSLVGARAAMAAVAFGFRRGSFRVRFTPGVVLGALGVSLTSTLFIIANKMTTAANAIVLQYAAPIVVILFCWVYFRQRPTKLDILAACITGAGVVLCFMGGLQGGSPLGDTLALLSAFTFATVFFAVRMPNTDPLDYTYLGNLFSALLLLAIPFDQSFALDTRSIIGVLLMGLSLTVGYLLFSQGLRTGVNPVTAAIVANVEPVLNPLWVYLVIGEQPGPYTLLGAALVLLSVTLYSILKGRQEQKAAPGAADS